MSHFKQLPKFEKEFFKLSNKYPSLPKDFKKLERLLEINPTGSGKNFVIIHNSPEVKMVKARMMCKSLRDRSMRIIYAYHEDILTFCHIEIYFKGDKENEDMGRVREYLRG